MTARGSNAEGETRPDAGAAPWRVLVVDDNRDALRATRLALEGCCFHGRPAEVMAARSALDAEPILRRFPDIALILLDVVMEPNNPGLGLVRTVRDGLGNHAVRFILRSRQTGAVSVMRAVADYDINDCYAEGELTEERLTARVVLALRAYQQRRRQEDASAALSHLVEAAVGMFRASDLPELFKVLLVQWLELFGDGGVADALFCARQRDHVTLDDETVVVSGFGRYAGDLSKSIQQAASAEDAAAIEAVIAGQQSMLDRDRTIIPIQLVDRWSGALMIAAGLPETSAMRKLVDSFGAITTTALENFYRLLELRRSNKATVVTLAELAEQRGVEAGEHVFRVARLSSEIARELKRSGVCADRIDDSFLDAMGWASMLHDIGKIGVPDHILNKTGALNGDERVLMERHARMGAQALDKARRLAIANRHLDLGWEIALRHHEWFDGSGYPDRLKGEDIPLSARIAAVADVFDTLTSLQLFKPAWRFEDAIAYIIDGAGRQFDPAVVEAFQTVMANWLVEVSIRWTQDLSVGHPQMDEDHRRLFKLINQLAVANAHGDGTVAESVLDELIHSTDLHFSREERHMRCIGFFRLAEHQVKHIFLAEQLATLRQRFLNGLPGRLNNDLIGFFSRWLVSHILIEDMQYHLAVARLDGRSPNVSQRSEQSVPSA